MSDPGAVQLISSFRPRVGGAERVAESLCRELRAQGTETAVLTRRYPGLTRNEDFEGVRVRRAGYPGRKKLAVLTYALDAFRQLAWDLRDLPVVHAHSTDAPLLVGLAARLLLGRRLVLSIHTDPAEFLASSRWRGRWRLRLANRLADRVISLSETMTRDLIALGVDAQRVTTISNGVDTDTFVPAAPKARLEARKRLGLDFDGIVYLFVGRLVELKGVARLLQAWSQDPPGRRLLLIVGDGEERETLEAMVAARADVRFAGHQENVAEYLVAADVFVLPSTREGQSIALLEAMASGMCVVASDIPANRELFPEAHLFSPEDTVSLREALEHVEDPDVRSSAGKAARRRAEAHSIQAMAARVAAVYRVALQ